MIQWKQRLYAFLLRRILGPFLDASASQKLHDSLDVSFQEGVFVLKDVVLDSVYLTERLTEKVPGLSIRSAKIDRLEIHLTLRENQPPQQYTNSYPKNVHSHGSITTLNTNTNTTSTTSSLAWRAMKLGTTSTMKESLPAVSLIAEVIIDGISLELEPIDRFQRRPASKYITEKDSRLSTTTSSSAAAVEVPPPSVSSKSVIGSYVDAALASLQLNIKLTNIVVKLHGPIQQSTTTTAFVEIKISMLSYKSLDVTSTTAASTSTTNKLIVHKLLEVGEICITSGMSPQNEKKEEYLSTSMSSDIPLETKLFPSTMALAEGSGQIFYRVFEYNPPHNNNDSHEKHVSPLQQDIEIKMIHQINVSIDYVTLTRVLWVLDGFHDISEPCMERDSLPESFQNSSSSALRTNPFLISNDADSDRDDLKALTGIMRQYREAYHLAEQNQLRGGILVPSNAYLNEGPHVVEEEEVEDDVTFDIFFDANDQSFYNATSVLAKSIQQSSTEEISDNDDAKSEHISTKIKMHLMSCCVKLVFREKDQIGSSHFPGRPEEYMLVTVEDLSFAFSTTKRSSDVNFSIVHFEIEDAQFINTDHQSSNFVTVGGSPKGESSVDIEKIFGFVQDSTTDPSNGFYENEDAILSQAPSVLCSWSRSRRKEYCNISILPIQLIFRHRTMSNLVHFHSLLQESTAYSAESSHTSFTEREERGNSGKKQRSMELIWSCPSIELSIPILDRVATAPLFIRAGELLPNEAVTQSSIGILLENASFELVSQPSDNLQPGESSMSGGFSCQHLFLFATSPQGDKVAFGQKMLRKDICAISGRLEVNPIIPISVNFANVLPDGKDLNPGRDSFPIVPAISSFKARQEDDDDESNSQHGDDSVKIRGVNTNSKKDLRATDPQISMLADSEKSNFVVTVHVPEVLSDLTIEELMIFLEMVHASVPSALASTNCQSESSVKQISKPSRNITSIAISFEQITISMSEDIGAGTPGHPNGFFSCIFAGDMVKSHFLLIGSEVRHIRLMCHDPCVYASLRNRSDNTRNHFSNNSQERMKFLKSLIRTTSTSTLSTAPLLFRSRMFTPISNDTPSILIDMVNTPPSSTVVDELKQKKVHLTFYHLTCRYDVDSDWIHRLTILTFCMKPKPNLESTKTAAVLHQQSSMTRAFISCADINLDYVSPRYFEIASRSIVRAGDFRFSSNFMIPTGSCQAFSCSIGDINYHISNTRMSYGSEDMRLCRSSWFIAGCRDRGNSASSIFGAMPEAILREMDFVNVLSLDTMDAVAVLSLQPDRGSTEPPLSTKLMFGNLSIHACKDSFNCFASSVGELQAKLTALTEKDFSMLKDACTASRPLPAQMELACPTKLDDLVRQEQSIIQSFIPEIEFKSGERGGPNWFLLDGYEWTTIDHDPLVALDISPGEEQKSGWYGSGHNAAGTLPTEIIHHHFPIQAVADPFSKGDMGAKRYAGRNANVRVKSRFLIEKLNVRIRFFDGYDWPDSCTDIQREAATRQGKMFVIEPLPAAVLLEKQKSMKAKIDKATEVSTTRKAQLLGELLDGNKIEISPFHEAPLPEDRAVSIECEKHRRMNCRRSSVFFQISLNGLALRLDSFKKSDTHQLQSVMEVSVSRFFVAETVSFSRPLKMFGEWSNDEEHPRDTRFGTVMISMATWAPFSKVTPENTLASDDCEVTVQLLPMRLLLDQRAIAFVRAFVNDTDEDKKVDPTTRWTDDLHLIPPPNFKIFKIKPWKVKVDYNPNRMDVAALREGSIVELVNLSPIHRMVITLSEVIVVNSLGPGPVFSEVVSSWVKEICGTQLHKFLANARPFEPFTDVGQGLTDLVILPYDAFKQGDSIQRAMKKGMRSLADTVIFQTLTTSSSLTKTAADLMAALLGGGRPNDIGNPLVSRPVAVPKGMGDVRRHACESLARGIQTANYKVVVVPFREYSRNGVTGAVTSVIKGIPVLLVAPLTGATEAASYTLLGARNALRPDIRKEEEASMSLH